jgi:hypothetical protein
MADEKKQGNQGNPGDTSKGNTSKTGSGGNSGGGSKTGGSTEPRREGQQRSEDDNENRPGGRQ